MDCKKMMAVLAAVAVFLPAFASAADFVVGDDKGWTLGVNYTEWSMGKEFKVGDKLIFNYKVPNHDVAKVDGPSFRQCAVLAGNEPLATGMDEITLATAGKKWYLCSKGDHCDLGMKLVINVVSDAEAPAPSPSSAAPPTSSSSTKIATLQYKIIAAVAAAVAMAIMI